MYKLFLLTTQVTSTWTIFSHEFPFFFTETSIFPHWTPIFLVLVIKTSRWNWKRSIRCC